MQPRAREHRGPEAEDEERHGYKEHDLEAPAERRLRRLEAIESVAAEKEDQSGDLEGDQQDDAKPQIAFAELVDYGRFRPCERTPLRSLHGDSSLRLKEGPGPLAGFRCSRQ